MADFEQAARRRSGTSLNERWTFRPDPRDDGTVERWYAPGSDWPDGRAVDIPHVWQEIEALREYTGVGWYRRHFEAPALDADKCVLVRFGAVDYEATVYVNGEKVATNRGGYLPFDVDLTDHLQPGENTFVVRVHDPSDLSEIPHGKQGDPWYTRVSGVWQSVELLTVPVTRVTASYATPCLDEDVVRFEIETTAPANADVDVHVWVTDADEIVAAGEGIIDGSGVASLTLSFDDPDYWTPESPTLYNYEIQLTEDGVLDTYTDYFGMRSIDVRDGDLFLNGESLALRGALDQGYYPGTLYRPQALSTYEMEIRTAKELGFNMLRKHIKVAHPRFVELADELGILVWQEPANPDEYTDRSKRELKEQFEEMIDRDYNSPSVVVWSLYNEEWGIGNTQDNTETESLWEDDAKQRYLRDLYDHAREYDSTRLICDNSGWAHVKTDLNDYHEYFVLPDRAGAWRERLDAITDNPADNYATDRYDDPAETPLLVSEFGTWGLPDIAKLHTDGTPHWFDHAFLDGLKRPAGVEGRFVESPLSETFDDLTSLAAAWQRRELQSVTESIRDMRRHEDISGYVLTEFSDIEWEFNGLLDYTRSRKEIVDEFAAVNAPVTAWIEPRGRVFRAGDSLVADVVVVNDRPDPTTVRAEWTVFGDSGTATVEIDGNDVQWIEAALTVEVPNVEVPRTESLVLSLDGHDITAISDVAVAPETPSRPSVAVSVDDVRLANALRERGHEVVAPTNADVSLVTKPSEVAADIGGDDVLVLPGRDGYLGDIDGVSVTELPERESWNLCACFVFQTLFEEVDLVPGWAFDDLYPYGYVDSLEADDIVDVGYVEGWIANTGAISLTRRQDSGGSLSVCMLRVTDAYGNHPFATEIVDRLLKRLAVETR